MQTRLVCVAVAALLCAVLAASQQVQWDRANNPFMRMAKKIDLVETASTLNAKAAVKHASRVVARQLEGSEESSAELSEAAAEESSLASESVAEESSYSESASEVATEESSLSESASESASESVTENSSTVEQVKQQLESQQPASGSSGESAATAELKRLQAEAEVAAKRMMEAATEKAKQIIAAAKAKVLPKECEDDCDDGAGGNKKKVEWREVTILKPQNGVDGGIEDRTLGLSPTMNVDTIALRHAIKIGVAADDKHQKFIDQHEINCAGPICPAAKN